MSRQRLEDYFSKTKSTHIRKKIKIKIEDDENDEVKYSTDPKYSTVIPSPIPLDEQNLRTPKNESDAGKLFETIPKKETHLGEPFAEKESDAAIKDKPFCSSAGSSPVNESSTDRETHEAAVEAVPPQKIAEFPRNVFPSSPLKSPSLDRQRSSNLHFSPQKTPLSQIIASPSPVKESWVSEQARLVYYSSAKRNLFDSGSTSPGTFEKASVVHHRSVTSAKKNIFKASDPSSASSAIVVWEDQETNRRVSIPKYKSPFSTGDPLPSPRPVEPPQTQTKLPLPSKFRHLLELFRAVDSVLFLMHQRRELCTFKRLKKSVEEMTRKAFDKKHLGTIAAVFPESVCFHTESNPGLSTANCGDSSSELLIEPRFETDKETIGSSVLTTRRHHFEQCLLNIVKEDHKRFLRKINLEIPDAELKRWHPRYALELVPDIEPALLPDPNSTSLPVLSVQQLLQQSKLRLVPKAEAALRSRLGSLSEASGDESTQETLGASKRSTVSTVLQGVSPSLIARIQQKERDQAELQMLRDPDKERRLAMLTRLPEITRILKTHFSVHQRASLPLETCARKIAEVLETTVSAAKAEEHLRLLTEVSPKFATVVDVRKVPYLKLFSSYDIRTVLQDIDLYKKTI